MRAQSYTSFKLEPYLVIVSLLFRDHSKNIF